MIKSDINDDNLYSGGFSKFYDKSCGEIIKELNENHRNIESIKEDDVVIIVPDNLQSHPTLIKYDSVKKVTPKSIALEHTSHRFNRNYGTQTRYNKYINYTIYDTNGLTYKDVLAILNVFSTFNDIQYNIWQNLKFEEMTDLNRIALYARKNDIEIYDVLDAYTHSR